MDKLTNKMYYILYDYSHLEEFDLAKLCAEESKKIAISFMLLCRNTYVMYEGNFYTYDTTENKGRGKQVDLDEEFDKFIDNYYGKSV